MHKREHAPVCSWTKTDFFLCKCKNVFLSSLHSSRVVKATRATTASRHLGAPWCCNHITVVPLLPSVVYRNCKQRGICDLEFWILRDAALLTPKAVRPDPCICVMLGSWKHGRNTGGGVGVGASQPFCTDRFHIDRGAGASLRCLSVSRGKRSLKYSLHKTNHRHLITLLKGKRTKLNKNYNSNTRSNVKSTSTFEDQDSCF